MHARGAMNIDCPPTCRVVRGPPGTTPWLPRSACTTACKRLPKTRHPPSPHTPCVSTSMGRMGARVIANETPRPSQTAAHACMHAPKSGSVHEKGGKQAATQTTTKEEEAGSCPHPAPSTKQQLQYQPGTYTHRNCTHHGAHSRDSTDDHVGSQCALPTRSRLLAGDRLARGRACAWLRQS